jgi:Amt family ammonium transporter
MVFHPGTKIESPGASTANLSLRSVYVVVNTNLAACGGGIGWTLLEYFYTKKFSIIGFCSGIISGLVGITPAAGYGKNDNLPFLPFPI